MVSNARGARVLIVDDDPAVTSLLRRAIAYEGYEVATAASGDEALAAAYEQPPDLVVLDVMLPGIDGMEVCRRLRMGDPNLPILMLTARDEERSEIQGLGVGADDYVTKPFSIEVLVARIRSLLRRTRTRQLRHLQHADLVLDTAGYAAVRGERRIELTRTEFDLLLLFISHPEQVLTKEQILAEVWGDEFRHTPNLVEVYVRLLRQKLEAGGEPRLLHTVRGVGYVLRES